MAKATALVKNQEREVLKLADEYRKTLTVNYYDPLMLQAVMLIGNDYGAANRTATRSGVTSATIRNWQKRKTHRPNVSTLRFVLRALGYQLVVQRVR